MLCWLGVFSEGYNLGVMGAVLPGILKDPEWHLTMVEAGALASAALVGMFVGGIGIGAISDHWGRRRCFIGCFALLTLTMAAAAAVHQLALFAVLRFLSGIGIGGIIPVAAALTSEFAAPERRNREFTLMYSGYAVGIFVAALVSYFLLARLGWRAVMGIGGGLAVLLPVVIAALPESVAYLLRSGQPEKAMFTAARFQVAMPAAGDPGPKEKGGSVMALFGPSLRRATAGFALTYIFGMILVYGLNTWLPQIMRSAGYDLGPSILFLGVFALSSAVGGVVLGAISDSIGQQRTICAAFAVGVAAVLGLSYHMPQLLTYMVVAVAGIGTVSASVLLTSYASAFYPPHLKSTAVGFCGSISRSGAIAGPMIGGLVAAQGLPFIWNFMIYALAGVISACCILIVPGRSAGEHGA